MKLIDKIDFRAMGEKKFFKKLKLGPKSIRRILNAAISIAVIVAIVAVNVAVTSITEKYPMNLDLTSGGDYSTTTLYDEENKDILEFVKGISNKIDITVCIGELDTANGLYQTYMENLHTMTDETSGKYYEQMKALIAAFPKLNSNISVKYQSTLEPAFTAVSARFPDTEIQYGDILVESTFKNSLGAEITRQKIVSITELYEVEDKSGGYAEMGMSYYTIVGSNLEQLVTQALYYVTSEKSVYCAVLSDHGCDLQNSDYLFTILEGNNYEFIEVENLMEGIDEKCEFLFINAPTADFTNDEIAVIEKFLTPSGEGLQQKTLFYTLDIMSDLPVFNEFLQEWGFEVYDEIVYSNVKGKYNQSYVAVQPELSTDNNNLLPDVSNAKKFAYSTFRAFKITDENANASLLKFGDDFVAIPIKEITETSEWTPDKATLKGNMQGLAVSVKQEAYGTGASPAILTSNIVVAGSTDLYSSVVKSSAYANSNFFVGLFNKLANLNTNAVKQIEFVPKEIVTDSFADQISGTSAPDKVKILFAIPIALAVIGIVVWVRRRRR